ncbi:uncharacterized protein FIBRA_00110 [Fibroporia radiculosa]|uniref:Uncharacterized protein n=1 Tax=Fibroporia radiculosa TaxID=599839 RepID=J7SBT8_9APHY|nr:uncharacterized protein FIBRA_00110 [Fibroporia radiculosa]CCL98116.1 predicted protein [Fibroporia radiculosa]
MSFQHFRLSTPIIAQPTTFDKDTAAETPPSTSTFVQALAQQQTVLHSSLQLLHSHLPTGPKKGPYGSGDADDGYTMVFPSETAFQEWRRQEEEGKMVEFVKGDTHGSKAVPPRFKDHTKLVCARHSRTGRKKYIKKFPDRVRKIPSRKLDGMGCPASISYKTYFDTEEVRVMYFSEHSHEIGLANLPFTKRGRKAQAEQQTRARRRPGATTEDTPSSSSPPSTTPPLLLPANAVGDPSPVPSKSNAIAGPSSMPHPIDISASSSMSPEVESTPPSASISHSGQAFQSAVTMVAPLPLQHGSQHPLDLSQERWDRMSVLFGSIREHARSLEYPPASVAALECVLVRLYLESPMAGMSPPQGGMVGMDLGMTVMNEISEIGNSRHLGT